MKKLLLVAGLSVLVLVGCNMETGDTLRGDSILVDVGDLSNGYDLVRDTNTGCIYINNSNDYALIPYYGEDGKVMGCGEENLDKSKYE